MMISLLISLALAPPGDVFKGMVMTGIQFIVQQMTQPKIEPKKPPVEKRTAETHLEPYTDEIIRAYKSGNAVNTIANKYDVSGATTKRFLSSKGIHVRSQKEQRELRQKLVADIESGEITKAEAAQKMGVKPHTVNTWIWGIR